MVSSETTGVTMEQNRSLHVLMRLLEGKRSHSTSPTPSSHSTSPTPTSHSSIAKPTGLDLLASLALRKPTVVHNAKRKRLASECLPTRTQSRKRCKLPSRPYIVLKDDSSKRYMCLLCKRRVGDLRWITRHKCAGDPNFEYRPLKNKSSKKMVRPSPAKEASAVSLCGQSKGSLCRHPLQTAVPLMHRAQTLAGQVYPHTLPLPTQYNHPVRDIDILLGNIRQTGYLSPRPKRQAAIKSQAAWAVLKPEPFFFPQIPQKVATIPTTHPARIISSTQQWLQGLQLTIPPLQVKRQTVIVV